MNSHESHHASCYEECCLCCLPVPLVIAFWYKPDASHRHLYPSLKDENGDPVKVIKDGETEYAMDPVGIEVFTNTSGPEGTPSKAPFAQEANNPSKVCSLSPSPELLVAIAPCLLFLCLVLAPFSILAHHCEVV